MNNFQNTVLLRKPASWLVLLFLLVSITCSAQFYTGSFQLFGKNRVQYDDFEWMKYNYKAYNVYFYAEGQPIADYTARYASVALNQMQKSFDFFLEDKLHFVIYNKMGHFRQSNIDIQEDGQENMGGVTNISGAKVFLYFDGNHADLEYQIRAGITRIIISQMMYGDNWRDKVKNSALLSLPTWFTEGLVSYKAQQWSNATGDKIRDLIMSNRFKNFNRLEGEDAVIAGHAMWYYIGQTYGQDVISNILYMARISRNIESGFLFVLGHSLQSLNTDADQFFRRKFLFSEEDRDWPDGTKPDLKIKKKWHYNALRISPDGKMIAYVTNEHGQYKVWLHDLETGKTERLLKREHKLDRINDLSQPRLAWHPNNKILAVINERKGEIRLHLYTVGKHKAIIKNIFKLEKVLDFAYSPDGRNIVMSAVAKGQSDIYLYNVSANSQEKLTDDLYDDRYPRFINDHEIIFSSNRDTLSPKVSTERGDLVHGSFDLYTINVTDRDELARMGNTPGANEIFPVGLDDKYFSFISDESGINNRYIGFKDSTINSIDTTVHYRYFIRSNPVTNYTRGIIEQDASSTIRKYAELIYDEGRYSLLLEAFDDNLEKVDLDIEDFKKDQNKKDQKHEEQEKIINTKTNFSIQKNKEGTFVSSVIVFDQPDSALTDSSGLVDIKNYSFEGENAPKPKHREDVKKANPANHFITLTKEGSNIEDTAFVIPKGLNYHRAFASTEVVSQIDYNFANNMYQPFNGGPYINPGVGAVVKVGMRDLFEDYKVEGGLRYAFSSNLVEYFLQFTNYKKRLDKQFEFQRRTITLLDITRYSLVKVYTDQANAVIRWPFSEVSSIKLTGSVRSDHYVWLSPDISYPDDWYYWAIGKAEYIFDNTRNPAMNTYAGTRYKLFFEHYNVIGQGQSDMQIAGLDFRHYIPIVRSFIWANRVAASTSFGSRKLAYYLGAMDNWITLSKDPKKPKFDNTPISPTQNYYFQTLATNLRGFSQNIRNGNSFVVINSELRFPIFRFMARKPIKSDLLQHFQITAFGDVGTAWTGSDPWSDENSFNSSVINRWPVKVILRTQKSPIVGGYGFGARSQLFGYFVKFDYAWGVEDGLILKPMSYFSLGLDF